MLQGNGHKRKDRREAKGKLIFGKDLMKRQNKKGCRQGGLDSSLSQRWEWVAGREGDDAGGGSHGTTSPHRVVVQAAANSKRCTAEAEET